MAGHVRRRGDRWQARYPDPIRGGTAKVERTFRTKRDAERFLADQQAAANRGLHVDPRKGDRPFSELAEAWRSTWGDLGPSTRAGYASILGTLEARFGNARIADLSPDVIQVWVNELAERRATNTVRRQFTVLRGVCRLAVERRYIAVSPCDAVRLPRKRGPKREQLSLTPEEVAALAEAVHPHFRVLVLTAAWAGLRAGELGGLRRRRVDLLHGTIRVEESLKEISGHLVFGEPKSDASRRTVSLPRFLRDELEAHLAGSSPGGNGPDDLVFTTPTGKPIRHNLFYRRMFRPAVERALPEAKHRLRFHDLRHTCASLSLAVSPNLHAVKERLGHEDIRTTINTYGHLVPSVDAALCDGLDALYRDAAPGEVAMPARFPAARIGENKRVATPHSVG